MKKFLIITVLTLIISGLFAHSASKVTASFDKETKLLTVQYEHKVRDAMDHFIQEVDIEINGKEIISQLISYQETNTGGELIYRLPDFKIGDEIKIITECNKSGKKSGQLTIE